MERTVELHIDLERLYEGDNPPTPVEVSKAVGYFSMWGENPDKVRIYSDGANDLIASFFVGDRRVFVIGAVWRGTEYTFHS